MHSDHPSEIGINEPKKRRNESLVWSKKYATKDGKGSRCLQSNCTWSCATQNTTTIIVHLSSRHSIQCVDQDAEQEEEGNKKLKGSLCHSNSKHSEANQTKRTNALIKWIIDRHEPFRLVDNKRFLEFIHILDPK